MEVYGNITEIPIYNQIEETNEIYFSVKIKTIEQKIIDIALASSVDNDYEKYKLNRPIYAFVSEKNDKLKIAKKVEFISKRDLIDKALLYYKNEKITLDNYIQVCRDNADYEKKSDNTEENEIEYQKNVIRQIRNDKRFESKGDIIKGFLEEEIYEIIGGFLKSFLEENDINTDVVDFQIIGSRNKGTAKKRSDLDVLIEYNNDNYSEDSLFNSLNDETNGLKINGIVVDFNPITPSKSGTIEEWLESNYDYNKYEEELEE
ncbi:MAG: hypothetical protein HFJ60_04315 [Clostridia bacterium]|jgi:predicted nucleotidyltransferase|nr:hypothetical protein [Clostridia bacterium]